MQRAMRGDVNKELVDRMQRAIGGGEADELW